MRKAAELAPAAATTEDSLKASCRRPFLSARTMQAFVMFSPCFDRGHLCLGCLKQDQVYRYPLFIIAFGKVSIILNYLSRVPAFASESSRRKIIDKPRL